MPKRHGKAPKRQPYGVITMHYSDHNKVKLPANHNGNREISRRLRQIFSGQLPYSTKEHDGWTLWKWHPEYNCALALGDHWGMGVLE